MSIIDTFIVVVVMIFITGMAVFTKRYTRSVADFLAANRCAGRYLLCISEGMAGLGAITVIANFEVFYNAGFTAVFWQQLMIPIWLIVGVSGWVIYRFRETRALTMAQFFEARYSESFRVFAGILAWVSGIVNFGIFPSVGARFFMYFLGFPERVFGASTYILLMLGLLLISLLFVFLGGQIAVIVTDFLQGIFSNIAFLVIITVLLVRFDWSEIIKTLLASAPENASLIHPFKSSEVEGFNYWFYLITAFAGVYQFRAWLGSQAYNSSAKNAHEAKMAGILGTWRFAVQLMFLVLLPVVAYFVMHNTQFAAIAADVTSSLDTINNPQVAKQMTVPLVLARILPTGLLGAMCALMLCAFISTHDTYLHSWGSIFIQDVFQPLYKKTLTEKQHMWLLRGSILFVAVFVFCFSLIFKQTQYVWMFFAITGAIWLGGAGAVILGGLYWKHGTTRGAWAALIVGCVVAVGGIVVQNSWENHLYPWLSRSSPQILGAFTNIVEGIAQRVPGINWEVTPEKFPVDGQWMLALSMLLAIISYIIGSLFDRFVLKVPEFNLDQLLCRGKYAIKGEHERNIEMPATGWRSLLPTKEYSFWDKVIYGFYMAYTLIWLGIFVGGTIYNATADVQDEVWAKFWWWYVVISFVLAVATVIWFLLGGIKDMKHLFKTLSSIRRDLRDDGSVVRAGKDMVEALKNE
ncbi:sodium:solute symporter family protein [Tichowtungia aerotolerans]|uniref:Sodium:solute symporter n=1 Tax=Tichowtungia aerotolerans TaxID=2697043 RepID=A0A6P1MF79_9BACT|nr:sodium:solute symporter [Tichowtungia aerotolerans]QHI70668.1 sodium:solute symporter [Tichowtungia aerotolerans]